MNTKIPLIFRFSLFAVATVLLASCSGDRVISVSQSTAASDSDALAGQTQRYDPDGTQWGPIRRDSFTDEQLERIKALHRAFAEVDEQPLDQWIDNFKRDLNLEEELAIWERVANAYSKYCESRDLSLDAKQDVYRVVVLRSTVSPDEVIEVLSFAVISEQDAREVMAGF